MSKRIRTLLLSILLGSTCSTFAQIYEDDSEIEFTDDRGRHEKIEYPPSMNPMYNELDSLLATYGPCQGSKYYTDIAEGYGSYDNIIYKGVTVRNFALGGTKLSDHYGLYCDITVKKGENGERLYEQLCARISSARA